MALKIETDLGRFRQIVRGKVRDELRRFMARGEMIGRKGKNIVSIPLPRIELPRFAHSPGDQQHVGQGEGEVGSVLGPASEGDGGEGQAGNAPGQHILEVEMTVEELAELMGEEFGLPRIRPKGKKNLLAAHGRYTGIATSGPESLRHAKRTFRQALKRQLASGTYDPERPLIVPVREEKRYRSFRRQLEPQANAVIFYVMDVSGSMGDEQKEIVRIASFWIDTWLRSQYQGLETVYVIHDAEAREVDRDTFFRTRESGGTVISSAYKACRKVISERFPPEDWNIYFFQFSDGDNWSQGDTEQCVRMLSEELVPLLNLFAYGQVESPYGSGQYIHDLEQPFGEDERVILSVIEEKPAIPRAIKEFLSTGR
ncbi:MAG: DUF444 family protein [Acidobacteriota bacterium]|nr:MAG: DUF444 family protein [Acidobacteriota bacterium]